MSIGKFSKIFLFSLSAVFVFPLSSFSQTEETLTIATYYPAPYGSYNELETRILYFGEEQDGLIAFNYPDDIRDRRLRITAGKQDGVANAQGAAVDLHGNNRPGDTGVGGELHLVAGSAGGPILFYTGDPADESMRITNTGSVGIGTITPYGILDIETDPAASNEMALFARTPDLRGLEIVPNLGASGWNPLSQPGDVGLIFRDDDVIEGGALVIGQWSNLKRGIRIDANGNVGIGIADPQAKLDVDGGVKIGNDPNCVPGKEGTIRYDGTKMQFCNGSFWGNI